MRRFFEQIKNEVEIIWPLETMDYGQVEVGIRDGDGYLLAFAEAVDETLRRSIRGCRRWL